MLTIVCLLPILFSLHSSFQPSTNILPRLAFTFIHLLPPAPPLTVPDGSSYSTPNHPLYPGTVDPLDRLSDRRRLIGITSGLDKSHPNRQLHILHTAHLPAFDTFALTFPHANWSAFLQPSSPPCLSNTHLPLAPSRHYHPYPHPHPPVVTATTTTTCRCPLRPRDLVTKCRSRQTSYSPHRGRTARRLPCRLSVTLRGKGRSHPTE